LSKLGDEKDLSVGKIGYSLDAIPSGQRGFCYFNGTVRYQVLAGTDIRKWAEVIVITLTPSPTVIETWSVFPLSYQLAAGGLQAVGEASPLPTRPYYGLTAGGFQGVGETTPMPTRAQTLYNVETGQHEVLRTPSTFKTGSLGGGSASTIWTPTKGKKFRLLGAIVTMPVGATFAAASFAQVVLNDMTPPAGPEATVFSFMVYVPAAAPANGGATVIPLILPGNGYLSLKADNLLVMRVLVGGVGTALVTGDIHVSAWGTEE
jgi:hypothetical protein